MSIYCWGSTEHGELGLGGIENERILAPRRMSWSTASKVKQISCGRWHTLFLTYDGKVFSCGNSDHGQLGHELPRKRPQLIAELDNNIISSISCGAYHSLALCEWGQIFSWGQNDCGQLGLDTDSEIVTAPKIVKSLVSKVIVQVACGNNHSLALTNCGELYAWGTNTNGQLGLASAKEIPRIWQPRLIESLLGIPVAFIACGGYHSFVISKSGGVFGFGRNTSGQLGLSDEINRYYPTQLKTLRSLGVRYISCGDEFSVFLTNDGGVFTCGSGTYGQLGHGNSANEALPRKVTELMGSTVTQVACGVRHTLAMVPSRGKVYGFGLGGSGQLGTRLTINASVPQVVVGPWVSPSGTSLIEVDKTLNDHTALTIKEIFAGGDRSLVTTRSQSEKTAPLDYRYYDVKTQILELTDSTAKQCSIIKVDDSMDLDLLNSIELIFKSLACLNGSFLLKNDRHICCTSKHHGVNLEEAQVAFDYLRKIEHENLKHIIWDKVTNELMGSLVSSPADVETLRIYLILPLYHEFVNSKNYEKLHTPFSQAVHRLSEIPLKIVSKWWAQAPSEWFEHVVSCYKDVVAYIISFKIPPTAGSNSQTRIVTFHNDLFAALDMLVLLHRLNHESREDKLHYEFFYWPELINFVDISEDYLRWLFDTTNQFNICNYPFLFNASAKTILLQTDQALQKHNAISNATSAGLFSLINFGRPIIQFIVLNVSRENLVADTLREIMQLKQNDLKKPLKIKFHGEEAEDAGGVRKEFFMLLLKDLLDTKYGMFREFEDSRLLWFSEISFETEDMYFLIGVICGLAIYNFTIINLPFPLALFKKLLNEPVGMSDLRDLTPSLAKSMQTMLDFDGEDFEAVFDLRFEISRDLFGECKTEPLKPNGCDIAVTLENRQEFVDLYVDFVFNKAPENQFKAFHKGFMKVCWGRVLQIFKPQELMAAIVGNEEYDWQALEETCEYKQGYSSSDQTVRWFWEVFHELSLEEKKKFLLFLTGSDRIPTQGMKAIRIFIQPTKDERFLPVAHTCFNLLDLPQYKTKERLRFKLQQAIQQTQGFSLV